MGSRYIVVDVETTGSDPFRDEIIEIGLVVVLDGQVEHSWQTLIRPEKSIPLRISQLTGITMDMVREAPQLAEILPQLSNYILAEPAVLVGHNISFDRSFLEAALKQRIKWECHDTVELSRWVYPLAPNHRLQTLTKYLAICHVDQHRALDDAKATAELYLRCLSELGKLPLDFMQQVIELNSKANWLYASLWTNLLREKASFFPTEGISADTQQESIKESLNLFSQPAAPAKKPEFEFDAKTIQDTLMPDGIIAKTIAGYEHRIQQVEMVGAVCEAFADDKYLLMEAGTGTGKSLAYLIPALYWSVKNQQKVVVATHTINLQEQLWKKDIPLLESILPFKFNVALVKGKSNYLCLRKWKSFLAGKQEFEHSEIDFAVRILCWLRHTESGDKSELHLFGRDIELWSKVEADRESCLGTQCPNFLKQCYSSKARRLAEAAHLLIANHSLVFSDIKTENKVLPSYDYLVLDEAHQIEDVATEHLGITLNQWSIQRYLNALFRTLNEDNKAGLLISIRQRQTKFKNSFGTNDYLQFMKNIDLGTDTIISLYDQFNTLFDLLGQVITRFVGNNNNSSNYRATLRLKTEHRVLDFWPVIESCSQNVCLKLKTLYETLGNMAAAIDRYQGVTSEEFQEESKLLHGQAQTALEIAGSVDFVLNGHDDNVVCWLELEDRQEWTNIILKSAPIQVGGLLHQKLFNEKKAVIMSSATLTVDGDFTHFINRVGLNYSPEEKILCRQAASPFAYDENALLCICRDIPSPSEISHEEYRDLIAPVIRDLVLVAKGRTLVLFTSHKMLKEVYLQVKPQLEAQSICLLGHGIDGSRARIVEEFQSSNRAVLFGANSFWEGVDLPGDVLRSVIIVRIPFVPPVLPAMEARLEYLQNHNINSFKQLSMPQAVIRLKQGFGRLIRTQNDYGVVVVLDNRLINKRYGSTFLRSLPVQNHVRGERDLIVQKVSDWLAEKELPEISKGIN